MIEYFIATEKTGDFEFEVVVFATGENGVQIMQGTTSVCVETEEEAVKYANDIFIPDLQRNYPRQLPVEVITDDVNPIGSDGL